MRKIITKLVHNFLYSINGLVLSSKGLSFKLELIWLILVMILVWHLDIGTLAKIVGVIAAILLLAVEMINTSIELLCDRITRDFDVQIKKIKDVASGSVFLILILKSSILFVVFFVSSASFRCCHLRYGVCKPL